MDLLATINHSISLDTRRRHIPKTITEAEFKNLLADLSIDRVLGDWASHHASVVAPCDDAELVIRGDHRRYAAGKAAGLRDFPFYAEPANREAIGSIIPVKWDNA
jgi:hypothetical protein